MTDMQQAYEELQKQAIAYGSAYVDLYQQGREQVSRWEYSRGGEVLHRGYYCPSPIFDIVVGNASRGHLLKRVSKSKAPDFTYGFSKDGRLVIADGPYCHLEGAYPALKEVILHTNELQIGLGLEVWQEKYRLNRVSICRYQDGRILSYVLGTGWNPDTETFSECVLETYTYANGILKSAIWQDRHQWEDVLFRGCSYAFQYDKNGCLAGYTAQDMDTTSFFN